MINNSDLSPTGQAELRSEWASNPNYKSEIAAYIVQVKKDSGFPNADINTNVNSAKTGKKREREKNHLPRRHPLQIHKSRNAPIIRCQKPIGPPSAS